MKNYSIFSNFSTLGWNIMKPTPWTHTHWGLSNCTKSAARGIVVWEISKWKSKQKNKLTSFIKEIPTFKNKLGACKGWTMVAKNPCKLYKHSTNPWMMLWKLCICVLLSCGYWCCDFKPSVSFQQLLKKNLEIGLEKIVYISCRHHHLW